MTPRAALRRQVFTSDLPGRDARWGRLVAAWSRPPADPAAEAGSPAPVPDPPPAGHGDRDVPHHTARCVVCGDGFVVRQGEVRFSAASGLPLPTACRWHRPTRRAQVQAAGAERFPQVHGSRTAVGRSHAHCQPNDLTSEAPHAAH